MCHIIFKFVPEDLLNAEHNSHNLEMYRIIRNQALFENLWNEIANLGGSWDNFVGAMTKLLGGGQRNDGLISSRVKDSSIQNTQTILRPNWSTFGLESVHFTWV